MSVAERRTPLGKRGGFAAEGWFLGGLSPLFLPVGKRAARGEVVTEPLCQPSELMIFWGTVPGVFLSLAQGVPSLRDGTRKDVEQFARKSFPIRLSRMLPII